MKELHCIHCDKLVGYAADHDLYEERWVYRDFLVSHVPHSGKFFEIMCTECREKGVSPLYPKPIRQ